MRWKVTPTVVHSINEYTSCFWLALTPFWVHRVPGSEGPSLPGTEILQLPHFFLADKGPSGWCLLGAHFFFFWSWYVILSVVRQSGQVTSCAATSDHTKALYLCWLHSENDDVVHKSCWGWHRLAEDESPGCRDWSTIWENCWESFVLFCFSMLETQLRTLYVLGKYLSNELHPFSPPFFLSEMRHCYVDLVGLEIVTLLLNVGSIGAYTGVFFSLI